MLDVSKIRLIPLQVACTTAKSFIVYGFKASESDVGLAFRERTNI
jgi:hypothetical protein